MEKIINNGSVEWYMCKDCEMLWNLPYFKKEEIKRSEEWVPLWKTWAKEILYNLCPNCGSWAIMPIKKIPKKVIDLHNDCVDIAEQYNKENPERPLEIICVNKKTWEAGNRNDFKHYEIEVSAKTIDHIYEYSQYIRGKRHIIILRKRWQTTTCCWMDTNLGNLISEVKYSLKRWWGFY